MSGICGIIHFDGKPVDPDLLKKMTEASAFRGPHGIRYWIDGNVGFAHLALNTTPESLREQQPLQSHDGTVCLTADARVDNRKELIRTLTSSEHLTGRDPTDADLILAAYRHWGEECADHIIGDFAFAVWDAARQKLFCARDAVGARLFHYSFEGQTFRFGTDVRQILADERVRRDLDGYAIADFLTLNFRYQARSMFASVQKLLPGHCMVLDENGPRGWRYWNPDRNLPIRYQSDEEYVEHFREIFFRCVADRMRSINGAVAIMTSGGVDSSSIAAVAQHLYVQGKTTTQPVAYHEIFDTLKDCDEREYSLTLPTETGIEFHEIQTEEFSPLGDVFVYPSALDNPTLSYDSLTHHVMQKARTRGCNVIMTGFGGDSLFDAAKWQHFEIARSGRLWRLWPWLVAVHAQGYSWGSALRSHVMHPLLPMRFRYLLDKWRGAWTFPHVPVWVHPDLIETTQTSARLYQRSYPRRYRSGVRQVQYEHIIGLAQQGVAIEQFVVYAAECSLDMCHPLLDRRLADFVLATPLRLGAYPGAENTKWILRQSTVGILPEKIRCRPNKIGWDAYNDYMFCKQIKERLHNLFSHTKMNEARLVDDRILLNEFDSYCLGTSQYHSSSIFLPPLLLEQWLRAHFPEDITIQYNLLKTWQYE